MSSVPPISDVLRLDGASFSLIIDFRSGCRLVHAGNRLPDGVDLVAAADATSFGTRESQPDDDLGLTLLPQTGAGFMGEPALVAEREGGGAVYLEYAGHEQEGGSLVVRFDDRAAGVRAAIHWRIGAGDLLCSYASIENCGSFPLRLHWLAALVLRVPEWADTAMQIYGNWSAEFQLARTPLSTGKIEKVNRSGRSGFDGAHYLLAAERAVRNEQGRVLAAHLAWSGNGRSLIETLPSGEAQLQIGEWLAPGEVVVPPGGTYRTPEALLAFSFEGLNGIRSAYSAELRGRRRASGVGAGPRKVYFNTWEATYFALDEARLVELADAAAAIGAERFVLDDGWFLGRRDDRRALGDWTVDPDRFPNGFEPLIRHLAARGMDFGLWVEPEMVSPDSNLYRAHPDWCLHVEGQKRRTQRQQLVLDLARPEVHDHVFGALDDLLRAYPIAYLKWDHNRDLFPASGRSGPAARAQTQAYYDLIDRVRASHPQLEIESCASGGARIDFGVADRVARVWASDNTDAAARLRIHEAMSLFYPPEMVGAHIGSSPNPTSGRRIEAAFRARVALFAHLGIEADPLAMSEADRGMIAAHVHLYKQHRALIRSGRHLYGDHPDPGVTVELIVADDRREALALVACTAEAVRATSSLTRLPGLDPGSRYRLELIEPWPDLAARHLGRFDFWSSAPIIDGATLCELGLRLPLVHPLTAWLVHLQAVSR